MYSNGMENHSTDSTEIRQKAFIESIRHGSRITDAAKAAGIHRTTAYVWMNSDPGFKKQVQEAKDAAVGIVWSSAFLMTQLDEWDAEEETTRVTDDGKTEVTTKIKRMRHYPSVAAIELFLRNHDPNFIERNQGAQETDLDELRRSLSENMDLGD